MQWEKDPRRGEQWERAQWERNEIYRNDGKSVYDLYNSIMYT